jgi:hypothetical protein
MIAHRAMNMPNVKTSYEERRFPQKENKAPKPTPLVANIFSFGKSSSHDGAGRGHADKMELMCGELVNEV